MNTISEMFAWLFDPANTTDILHRAGQHLGVSALAVVIAAVIAWPLGIAVGHRRRGQAAVAGFAGVMRSIPSLGVITLVALLVGIGLVAPIVALVILAIPSLLAGAYAGVAGVDEETVSAARAVGMRESQVISQVEIPLAAPVIMGGLRSAVMQVVSTTTLAAYTADVGLGRFLFAGLKTNDYALTLAAAVLVIVLAVLVDAVLATGNKILTRSVVHV
ncbi:ABC transporter permease [Corynebacterium tapiri]|uniref:ABC transporter permease n=1 Tax=Corynebacterium tapiri TaxID=1448266 RepID=A0A5C4U6T4_9CORY|nr:ABC transporter permease [Corynebacterium tapiri]TNM00489.1 ABC transporter permease [Corynebacterium tapiri]